MSDMPDIDIRPDHWEIVRDILCKHVPQYEVWAFGSRAKWTAKAYSDLDLAVITDKPLTIQISANLSEAFSESDLPWKVDVVDWATTSESFRSIIKQDKVVLQSARNTSMGMVEMTLREAGVSLIDCDHRTPPAAISGYPYIAIPQLREGRIDLSDVRLISAENLAEWTRKAKPRQHDVILSRRCNPGETAYVPEGLECALGQNLVLLRADGRMIFPPFLRWLVRGNDWWEQVRKFINVGAVFESLKCADIPNFSLPIPSLRSQRAIAKILGDIDEKIEVNRRTSDAIERLARAQFDSWFVDFDPVRAKLDGRVPMGISSDTLTLISGSFEDSAIGPVPMGWQVKNLDQIASYLNGLALQKYPQSDGSFLPVIKIAQLRKGDSSGSDKCSSQIPPEYVVRDGDVLFSWSGSLEVELWCGGLGALNQHLFKVTSSEYPKWFYYLWTRHHLNEFRRIAAGKATTMGHIQRGHLSSAKILVPPKPLLESMSRVMAPLIDQLVVNRVQSRTLAALRDSLLPKFLSGEVFLKDAEQVATEAEL